MIIQEILLHPKSNELNLTMRDKNQLSRWHRKRRSWMCSGSWGEGYRVGTGGGQGPAGGDRHPERYPESGRIKRDLMFQTDDF